MAITQIYRQKLLFYNINALKIRCLQTFYEKYLRADAASS